MLGFALAEFHARQRIEIDGVVVVSNTVCQQPHSNRCVTTYEILAAGATKPVVYKAGPNDHSLRRSLPAGTRLFKRKGTLSYEINGTLVDDFPRIPYFATAGVGIGLAVAGVIRVFRFWRTVLHDSSEPSPDWMGDSRGRKRRLLILLPVVLIVVAGFCIVAFMNR